MAAIQTQSQDRDRIQKWLEDVSVHARAWLLPALAMGDYASNLSDGILVQESRLTMILVPRRQCHPVRVALV
jgi:hypothetical protein